MARNSSVKEVRKDEGKIDSRTAPGSPAIGDGELVGPWRDQTSLTIAWTGIINSESSDDISISVQPKRYSHDIIEKNGEFVINLVPAGLAKAMDFCGVRSGRDVDKFEAQGLTREAADTVSAPLIAESPVNIECRVKDIVRMPSHDMFMAEITAVHVDEKYVDEKGAYDFGSMDLVAFNHGKYYRLKAEELGFFGFSVMKPKTAKRKAAEKSRRKR